MRLSSVADSLSYSLFDGTQGKNLTDLFMPTLFGVDIKSLDSDVVYHKSKSYLPYAFVPHAHSIEWELDLDYSWKLNDYPEWKWSCNSIRDEFYSYRNRNPRPFDGWLPLDHLISVDEYLEGWRRYSNRLWKGYFDYQKSRMKNWFLGFFKKTHA